MVAVFDGDTTPFLLRQTDTAGDTGNVYRIVSDCYLYGWMYGPFPDKTVAKDTSRRKSFMKKLKGNVKQESTPVAVSRNFVIS